MLAAASSEIKNEYEREFITALYSKYYLRLKKRALAILHDQDEAEEVVQESFVKFMEHLPTLMDLDKNVLPAYIMTTVKNLSISRFREKKSELKRHFAIDGNDSSAFLADNRPLPEDLYLQKEKLQELANVLSLLPERYRILLEAKYILEESDKNIAEMIGISEQSVRMYLTRARRQAFTLLEEGIVYDSKRKQKQPAME